MAVNGKKHVKKSSEIIREPLERPVSKKPVDKKAPTTSTPASADPLGAIARDNAIVKLNDQAHPLLRNVTALTIVSDEGERMASKLLGDVKSALDSTETRRKFFVDPMTAHVKRINAFFKDVTRPYEKADEMLRTKLVAYREAQRKALEARQSKLIAQSEAAAGKGQEDKALTLAAAASSIDTHGDKTVHVEGAKVTYAEVWEFEVVNAAQVPGQYLIPDERKIRAAVRSGLREIPGVRIYKTERPAVSVVNGQEAENEGTAP